MAPSSRIRSAIVLVVAFTTPAICPANVIVPRISEGFHARAIARLHLAGEDKRLADLAFDGYTREREGVDAAHHANLRWLNGMHPEAFEAQHQELMQQLRECRTRLDANWAAAIAATEQRYFTAIVTISSAPSPEQQHEWLRRSWLRDWLPRCEALPADAPTGAFIDTVAIVESLALADLTIEQQHLIAAHDTAVVGLCEQLIADLRQQRPQSSEMREALSEMQAGNAAEARRLTRRFIARDVDVLSRSLELLELKVRFIRAFASSLPWEDSIALRAAACPSLFQHVAPGLQSWPERRIRRIIGGAVSPDTRERLASVDERFQKRVVQALDEAHQAFVKAAGPAAIETALIDAVVIQMGGEPIGADSNDARVLDDRKRTLAALLRECHAEIDRVLEAAR